MEALIARFGYAAVFAGTFIEGETILIIAGFAAHRGYLSLPGVIAAAFLGSFIGDQIYFLIGRLRGAAFIDKHPSWRDGAARINRLLERYGTILILCFRFIYGIRTLTPFVIGMSRIGSLKFFLLNMTSAALWAAAISIAGYYFGETLESLLGDVKRIEHIIVAILAAAGALAAVIHWALRRRKAANAP